MTVEIDVAAAESLGREFVASIEYRDWERLAACLRPDVEFRAVVPDHAEPVRDLVGPVDTCAQIARWFDGGEEYELIGSTVDLIGDRLHVGYRVTGTDQGVWYLVEQHAFATLSGDRIGYLNLVCSGFRDIPPPD